MTKTGLVPKLSTTQKVAQLINSSGALTREELERQLREFKPKLDGFKGVSSSIKAALLEILKEGSSQKIGAYIAVFGRDASFDAAYQDRKRVLSGMEKLGKRDMEKLDNIIARSGQSFYRARPQQAWEPGIAASAPATQEVTYDDDFETDSGDDERTVVVAPKPIVPAATIAKEPEKKPQESEEDQKRRIALLKEDEIDKKALKVAASQKNYGDLAVYAQTGRNQENLKEAYDIIRGEYAAIVQEVAALEDFQTKLEAKGQIDALKKEIIEAGLGDGVFGREGVEQYRLQQEDRRSREAESRKSQERLAQEAANAQALLEKAAASRAALKKMLQNDSGEESEGPDGNEIDEMEKYLAMRQERRPAKKTLQKPAQSSPSILEAIGVRSSLEGGRVVAREEMEGNLAKHREQARQLNEATASQTREDARSRLFASVGIGRGTSSAPISSVSTSKSAAGKYDEGGLRKSSDQNGSLGSAGSNSSGISLSPEGMRPTPPSGEMPSQRRRPLIRTEGLAQSTQVLPTAVAVGQPVPPAQPRNTQSQPVPPSRPRAAHGLPSTGVRGSLQAHPLSGSYEKGLPASKSPTAASNGHNSGGSRY